MNLIFDTENRCGGMLAVPVSGVWRPAEFSR